MTDTKKEPERWGLILQPLPSDTPSEIRVRRLLKIALRSLRLKCLKVVDPNRVAIEDFINKPDEIVSATKHPQV
jgi:hypothetical protein